MMVRVYDAGSAHQEKLINVLVDVHEFTVGNGREIPLFKVHALKEALRRQQEAYQRLIIYAYKGIQQGDRFVVDTASNGPHDPREVQDVLGDDVCFPQEWTILIKGKDYPNRVFAWCYIEPMDDHLEVSLSTDTLVTAGELKKELKKILWPNALDLPSYYLYQIVVSYQEGADSRIRNDEDLILDYAARRHNHFYIRITDYIGQAVPRGHVARQQTLPRDGAPPEELRWLVTARLPPLHRSVDCGFEYPRTLPSGLVEGFDGPVQGDVSYFNVQPGTTAAAAVARPQA